MKKLYSASIDVTIILLYVYAVFVFMNFTYPTVLHEKQNENPFALFSINQLKNNVTTIKEVNQDMSEKVKLHAAHLTQLD